MVWWVSVIIIAIIVVIITVILIIFVLIIIGHRHNPQYFNHYERFFYLFSIIVVVCYQCVHTSLLSPFVSKCLFCCSLFPSYTIPSFGHTQTYTHLYTRGFCVSVDLYEHPFDLYISILSRTWPWQKKWTRASEFECWIKSQVEVC